MVRVTSFYFLALFFIIGTFNLCITIFIHNKYLSEDGYGDPAKIIPNNWSGTSSLPVASTLPSSPGKDKIIKILSDSGMYLIPQLVKQLPTEDDFKAMYGSKPKIIGLDTCEDFRKHVSPLDAVVGPSGAYNTGTNLLSHLLIKHCVVQERAEKYDQSEKKIELEDDEPVVVGARTGMFNDVPWDKHGPASWREDESYKPDNFQVNRVFPKLKNKNVFPIVMVKDPYSWMGSVSRHPYNAQWLRSPYSEINLNPDYDEYDVLHDLTDPDRKVRKRRPSPGMTLNTPKKRKRKKTIGLIIEYHPSNERWRKTVEYENFVDMWHTYYSEYLNATFPRLIVRYEDLLLHSNEVIPQICECVGGQIVNNTNGIHPDRDSAKNNREFGITSNLVDAIMRYGSSKKRIEGFSKGDLAYASSNIRKDMMDQFQYSSPTIDFVEEEEKGFLIQTPGRAQNEWAN
jgi:hypothetical protein